MADQEQTVRIGGRSLRLSRLDKVLYPQTGTTKADVIRYYTTVAPVLLPHLRGRPVTRKRWPDGVGTAAAPGASFFIKDLEAGAPAWLPRATITHSTGPKDYPLVDDVAALAYLAQVASLELHTPQWRFAPDGRRLPPDRMVLDLDPGPGMGLADCARVAQWARTILTGMGLDPVPVTSGSKGVHIYTGLPGEQTSDQVSAVAKELARALEADHPDTVVSAMAKSLRPGRVFVDWSQNNANKTTVSPYSLRGRLRPTVAAPRRWDELDDPHLGHLEFEEVLRRVAASGDLLAGVLSVGADRTDDAPLRTYIGKRSAARTPEPVPEHAARPRLGRDDRPTFVVQEHHARRLHHDFRLERDGVLVSWAVPKGIPDTSSGNHLAVQTEDHPLEYASFEGEIPRGEYGAGTVTIWDHGWYEAEKWHDDEIIVTMHGRPHGPLDGVRLALIRTSGEGEKSQWLLHRMKDQTSPLAPRAAGGRRRPMLATPADMRTARAAADRWEQPPWAEMKWDGVRALGVWDGSRMRLFARSGADITDRYPEIVAAASGFGADPVVVDGEIVALGANGAPDFARLQNRMHLADRALIARETERTPVRYYLFDIVAHGQDDLTSMPLRERRRVLDRLAHRLADPISVPPVFDDLDAALDAAERFGLEGIVVKNPASRYRPGSRPGDWLKVKRVRTQAVVIGGIRPGRGARTGRIGSLLVGIPGEGGLRYVGRVGTGFSEAELDRLADALAPLRAAAVPFTEVPAADAADAIWVQPEIVGEVAFAEYTPAGILRHPRWRGLRPDLTPDEVVRE